MLGTEASARDDTARSTVHRGQAFFAPRRASWPPALRGSRLALQVSMQIPLRIPRLIPLRTQTQSWRSWTRVLTERARRRMRPSPRRAAVAGASSNPIPGEGGRVIDVHSRAAQGIQLRITRFHGDTHMHSLSFETNLHRHPPRPLLSRSDFAAPRRFTSLLREEDLVRRRRWWTTRSRWIRANAWRYVGILAFLCLFVAIVRASTSGG